MNNVIFQKTGVSRRYIKNGRSHLTSKTLYCRQNRVKIITPGMIHFCLKCEQTFPVNVNEKRFWATKKKTKTAQRCFIGCGFLLQRGNYCNVGQDRTIVRTSECTRVRDASTQVHTPVRMRVATYDSAYTWAYAYE